MALVLANNSTPSRSYFQKTVTLQDWWLTKPETNADTKTLGVAGLTSSQQSRAARCFSSAPILKIYDLFELETVDGVCVILQGFINKDRTLENGFSPEVFDHFVIGFPPYWKEFSTNCPKRESAAKCVTRVQEDVKDSIEGHGDFHGKPQNYDIYTVHIGVKDCEDIMLGNKTITPLNPPSVEIPQELIIEAGNEVLCEKSPVTPGFEDDLSLETSPIVRNTVESSTGSKCLGVSTRCMTRSMKKMENSKNGFVLVNDKGTLIDPGTPGFENDLSLEMSPIVSNTVESSTGSKCLGVSTRCMTRSMKKMDNSKNSFVLVNDKDTLIDPGILGSSESLRKDINDVFSNNKKAIDVVDCDMKSKSRNAVSGGCGKGSNETASCSVDAVLKRKSKRGQFDQNVDVVITKDNRKCILNKGKNKDDADVNDNIVLARTNMKSCRNKKKSRVNVPQKEALMTRNKSKTKLLAKRKPMTSPKSTSSRGKKGSEGSANILSLESFSGKKSRSGRVVLPPLEFWRNQKVVYDEDGQMRGVQEPN